MRKKLIEFDNPKEIMAQGAAEVARAVGCTLGPKGRNVVLYLEDGRQHTTKDGVTVALFIKFKNPVKDSGAAFVQDAAKKTVWQSGDGTTTCTILANEILQDGVKFLKDKMHLAVDYVEGVQAASRNIVEELNQQAIPINGDFNLIEQVARISANNDDEMGKMIREAIEQVGMHSIIQADDSGDNKTYVKVVDGMEIQNGFKHPYYANDHRGRCVFEDRDESVKVIVIDDDLSTLKQVAMMFKYIGEKKLKAVIVCNEMIGEADSTALVNAERNNLNICVVNAPGMGDRRRAYLRDLAAFTGATMISTDTGTEVQNFNPEWMGTCEEFIADDKTSRFLMGGAVPEIVDKQIKEFKQQNSLALNVKDMADPEVIKVKDKLKKLYVKKKSIQLMVDTIETKISNTTDEFAIKKYKERIQRLRGKAAIIMVGAQTTQELRQKKDRVDDAIKATQASVEEGIVPGGGISFYNARLRVIEASNEIGGISNDAKTVGYENCLNSMIKVISLICVNAGADVKKVLETLDHRKGEQEGYNAKDGTFCNLITAGIINPKKVDRVAVENAVSAACTMLLTECVVYPDPDEMMEMPQQYSDR
jgi:chaperonin GroEL